MSKRIIFHQSTSPPSSAGKSRTKKEAKDEKDYKSHSKNHYLKPDAMHIGPRDDNQEHYNKQYTAVLTSRYRA